MCATKSLLKVPRKYSLVAADCISTEKADSIWLLQQRTCAGISPDFLWCFSGVTFRQSLYNFEGEKSMYLTGIRGY